MPSFKNRGQNQISKLYFRHSLWFPRGAGLIYNLIQLMDMK